MAHGHFGECKYHMCNRISTVTPSRVKYLNCSRVKTYTFPYTRQKSTVFLNSFVQNNSWQHRTLTLIDRHSNPVALFLVEDSEIKFYSGFLVKFGVDLCMTLQIKIIVNRFSGVDSAVLALTTWKVIRVPTEFHKSPT